MAAILCKPITACFEFIFTAPCKICAGGCKLCNDVCSGGCKLCSDGISGLCKNPLSAFLLTTWFTQVLTVVVCCIEIPNMLKGCKGGFWLLAMLVTAIVHIAASTYMANRVGNQTDEALRDRHSAWERISYLLCHDPWIALYILVVCFWVALLCLGSYWRLEESCEGDMDRDVSAALALGWFYFVVGPMVLSCNLCCACCDNNDYAADDAAFAAQEAEKESKKQKRQSSNNNSNYNSSDDIEMQESRTKNPSPQPRTYSMDGTPIPDDQNANVVEADVIGEADALPPPVPPPKNNLDAKAANAGKFVGGFLNKMKKGGNGGTKATLF